MNVQLILYSKPGCHLCEGLQEKLMQIESLDLDLDVRDITTRDDWFQVYEYEIPVLVLVRSEGRGERGEESGFDVSAQPNGVRSQESGVRLPRASTDRSLEAGEARGAEEAIQNSKPETSSFSLHPLAFISLPRPSPRATAQQLEQMLRKFL